MSDKKIKVLTLSDHPHMPSGVATQTKYVIEALLATNKFEVYSLGGAIKHNNYDINKVNENWTVEPVDGYGNQQKIRELLKTFRPDMIWFMTDPRFYEWLWDIEDEVREHVPIVYYHVWDNYPYPKFNKRFYSSTDAIATISKVTSDIVQTVSPEVMEKYAPHAVNTDLFKKVTDPKALQQIDDQKRQLNLENKFVFLWNNRNARRKQSGSLIFWFKKFLDEVGQDKASLILHTAPRDENGQPLDYIAHELGMDSGEVIFSTEKFPLDVLPVFYNTADCVVNIADAEGFGLSSLEALACEIPVINTMTGGLQEQVYDGENFFGIGLYPTSKSIIGSQQVPFIYEDRLSEEVVVEAFKKMYNMPLEERQALGKKGREHVMKNYNFENFNEFWPSFLTEVHERFGSWDTRKGYTKWEIEEL